MISDANRDLQELEVAIRRANDERYAFYRMLHTTDLVLWRLEDLMEDGVERLPDGVDVRIRESLSGLPPGCLDPLVGGRTQAVLDSIFDVQEKLFRWRNPRRMPAPEVEEEPPPVDEVADAAVRVYARELISDSPRGVAWSDLAAGRRPTERMQLERVLEGLESEDVIYCDRWHGRRYHLVREEIGG